ncbi:MAG: hypothetical protein AAFN16_22465, partial [Pseudomonadota bacterium]
KVECRARVFLTLHDQDVLEALVVFGPVERLAVAKTVKLKAFEDVLVVKGKENPSSAFDLLEIVEVTPAAQVTYPPDHPQFAGGALGTCNPGA